uniref:Uncharacterized protein n=1 Tax=Triticum urartu TaxID=4572 RepID=A0A8R7U7Q0_TRIUA
MQHTDGSVVVFPVGRGTTSTRFVASGASPAISRSRITSRPRDRCGPCDRLPRQRHFFLFSRCNTSDVTFPICTPTLAVSGVKLYLFP